MNTLSAKEIAELLGISKRAITLRAKNEGWNYTTSKCRGGEIQQFYVAQLPEDILSVIQRKPIHNITVNTARAIDFEIQRTELTSQAKASAKRDAAKSFAAMQGRQKQRAEAALTILRAASQYKSPTVNKTHAWNQFVIDYNSKCVELPEYVYEVKPSISYKTLQRWEKLYDKYGITALAGNYGKSKGGSLINTTPGMRDFCIALIYKFPHIKAQRLAELLEMQFQDTPIPTSRTCQNWLNTWKVENKATFLSLIDPSGWQNTVMSAFGNKGGNVVRLNQEWEFDSTPADVMLTDGRHSIVGVLDVFSRRVKLILRPTSNAFAIATVIREAILDWGLPEVARTDNGSDYLSAHITSVWDSLGIQNDVTNPYSGWEKPYIERFFRTFSHGMAELIAGFVGHNVAEREQINARLTFAQRLMARREKGKDLEAIEVALSATQFQEFINSWIENHYHHSIHSELGCTPFEKFSQHKQTVKRLDDVRILDVLLAPVPNQNGFRTVGKEGLRIEGHTYIHAELGPYVGERVFCRYNPKDIGKVYVFHALHQHFICEAVDPEIVGNDITMQHAQLAKRLQRQRLREDRAQIRKSAKSQDVDDIAQRYLDYRKSQNASLTSFPKPSVQTTGTSIDSAKAALAEPKDGYSEQQKTELERRRKELEAIERAPADPVFRDEHHKARYFMERNLQGLLSPTEKAWLHQYRREHTKAAAMLDKLFQQTTKGIEK